MLECTSNEIVAHQVTDRSLTSRTRDYALFLVKTSPGARVTAELGLCPDAEVPPRNLGKTIGGQRPIRRCPLLESI